MGHFYLTIDQIDTLIHVHLNWKSQNLFVMRLYFLLKSKLFSLVHIVSNITQLLTLICLFVSWSIPETYYEQITESSYSFITLITKAKFLDTSQTTSMIIQKELVAEARMGLLNFVQEYYYFIQVLENYCCLNSQNLRQEIRANSVKQTSQNHLKFQAYLERWHLLTSCLLTVNPLGALLMVLFML